MISIFRDHSGKHVVGTYSRDMSLGHMSLGHTLEITPMNLLAAQCGTGETFQINTEFFY